MDDNPDHIDLLLSDELRAFRQELRAFFQTVVPDETRRRVDRGLPVAKADVVALQSALNDRGWGAPSWPLEYGGATWGPLHKFLYNLEHAANNAPPNPAFGVGMVGPVIYTFGTPEQKAFYLPRILSGEDWWCQGFSEPDAGSDLASLRTRAEDKGDHYLLNGQKIWTTKAHYADRMFCLARTSKEARRQDGISFLIFDMDLPGIEVRPIISIDGSHTLNAVFFTDVEVPKSGLVGEQGQGWSYARFLLRNERFGITSTGRSRRQVNRLKQAADRADRACGDLAASSAFRHEVARVEAELTALEVTEIRMRSEDNNPAAASMLKIRGTEMQQRLTALLADAAGFGAVAFGEVPPESEYADMAGVMEDYLYTRAASIYGGTNEVQREIIARTLFG